MAGFSVRDIITRTNDTNAYGAGDVIGAATGSTAAVAFVFRPDAGAVRIRSSLMVVDAASVISGETSYNLHFYDETPPSALGDNAAWDLPSGDRANYVGTMSLGTPADIGSSLVITTNTLDLVMFAPTGTLWAYLVTVGAYTPTASRIYRIRLTGEAL